MKLSSAAVALFALVGLASGVPADSPPKSNPFNTSAPIPIDPAGLGFELRLPEGKIQFRQGETIPITLLFSNRGTQTLYLNTFHFSPPSMAVFGFFKAEPSDGVVNPLGDLPPQTGFAYSGPGPGQPQLLSEKPVEMNFTLNEYLRFDKPGTYQIRATTNHIFALAKNQQAPRQGSFFGGSESVTSTPLSIEIVPADPQWQQKQVDEWRAFWANQKPDPSGYGWGSPIGSQSPANDLRYLNTKEAAKAIIDRLGQDIAPRSSGSEAYLWRSGLIGFSDRLWLIGAMKDTLKRADYPVTQGFLDNLATLQGLYHVARPGATTSINQLTEVQEKAYLSNWKATYAALSLKRGRARAMTVHSLLEITWSSRPQNARAMQPHMAQLVAMVPDIFNDLPVLPQQYLLDDKYGYKEWNLVKSPRFVSPLVKAWKTVPQAEGWGRERGDLILRHLYELSPQIARPLILQEMASPHPRVSFEVLSLLKDKYLRQLQNIWWTHLTSNGPDQDMAALLIGRYATAALKTKVQKEYSQRKRDGMLSRDVDTGLKKYLARVNS